MNLNLLAFEVLPPLGCLYRDLLLFFVGFWFGGIVDVISLLVLDCGHLSGYFVVVVNFAYGVLGWTEIPIFLSSNPWM